MHSKYQRRQRHAGRAPTVQRRQPLSNTTPIHSGGSAVGSSNKVIVDGFTLTGPITLTFVTTVQSTPTLSSSSIITTSSTSSTVQSTSSSQTTSQTTSTTDSASQTPSTSSSPSPSTSFLSTILPTVTPSGVSSGNGTVPQQMMESSTLSTTQLAAGSIAGITIGCLIVLAAGLFYFIRSRSRRGRMKLRGMWTRNSPLGISPGSYEPKSYTDDSEPPNMRPVMKFAPVPQTQRQQPFQPSSLGVTIPASNTMPVPAPTYNNANFEATSPRFSETPWSRPPSSGFNATAYSPGTAAPSMSPFAAAVVCTFITSLPDELSIKVGETIRILAEYDDGWALCMNGSGEQGMVPLECLGRSPSTSPDTSGYGGLAPPKQDLDTRGMRRVSSLKATTTALKAYRI